VPGRQRELGLNEQGLNEQGLNEQGLNEGCFTEVALVAAHINAVATTGSSKPLATCARTMAWTGAFERLTANAAPMTITEMAISLKIGDDSRESELCRSSPAKPNSPVTAYAVASGAVSELVMPAANNPSENKTVA
jgi:hypothetical protein